MDTKPSDYERSAKEQIWQWKNPKQTMFDKAMAVVSWPLDKASDAVMNTPGLGPAIQSAFAGVLGVINDVSHWSVRPDVILDEYRRFTGSEFRDLDAIHTLDLQVVDRAMGWLDTKYEGMALMEGAAAGASSTVNPLVGLAAISVDVIALTTMNLRAVGEYATYCGFDIGNPEERLFALNVLAYASSPTDAAKQMALAQLIRIARDVALRKAWQDLEKHVVVQAIQQIAKSVSLRLTKAKLAQVLPVAGAALGGGFNAYYTSKVCRAAFYLYRERFLAAKYGVENIEITVQPADSLNPDYESEP